MDVITVNQKNHCIKQCVIKPGNNFPKTYANISKTNSNIIKDPKPCPLEAPPQYLNKTSAIRKITPPKPSLNYLPSKNLQLATLKTIYLQLTTIRLSQKVSIHLN